VGVSSLDDEGDGVVLAALPFCAAMGTFGIDGTAGGIGIIEELLSEVTPTSDKEF
jgi:hypothetical protein